MEKFTEMYVKMRSKLQDKKGATMVEYGLMLALIAAVCVGIVGTLGDNAEATFTTISNELAAPAAGEGG